MKLIRFGEAGKEKTGVIINNKRFDTSAFGEDYEIIVIMHVKPMPHHRPNR